MTKTVVLPTLFSKVFYFPFLFKKMLTKRIHLPPTLDEFDDSPNRTGIRL